MTNTKRMLGDLVALVGRDAAAPLVREALEAERPSDALAELLADAWRAYLDGGLTIGTEERS